MSRFSDFFHYATPEEREKVFNDVIDKANAKQKQLMEKAMNYRIDYESSDETFTIILDGGRQHYFPADKYRWQYGLVPGTIDTDDKSVVEVFPIASDDDEWEPEVAVEFSAVVGVARQGHGTVSSSLVLIMREQCPQCGFIQNRRKQ